MDIILAAATHQYPNGWGGPVAILIPFLLLWLATTGYRRLKEIRQEGSSPSAERPALDAVKPQLSVDSDSDDSGPDGGGAEVVPLRAKEIEAYIGERVDKRAPTALMREVRTRFGVSESTAWREIRKARSGGAA